MTSRSFSSGDLDLTAELEAGGCAVVIGPSSHDLEALAPLLASAVAWIAGTGPVTATHLAAAPQLEIIARYGVGTDSVDLAAAAERRILVTNTPGANTDAVADHTLALMLAALRHVTVGDRAVRAGSRDVRRTRQLGQLTVGIVGLGRIGRAVATRLTGFGSRLLGHDPWVAGETLGSTAIEGVALDELVGRSDVVTLHVSGAEVLVDERFLRWAKPSLVLVNTARAGLVDEAAVAAGLRNDLLRCYAADVLRSEAAAPSDASDGPASPLLAEDLLDRTLFTPHAAAQTVEAVDQMGRGAVDAVLAHLAGQPPPNLVGGPYRALERPR